MRTNLVNIVLYTALITSITVATVLGDQWLMVMAGTYASSRIYLFVEKLGKGLPFKETICFVASLELLIMPLISYAFTAEIMAVDANTYFRFTLPALLAMQIALGMPIISISSDEQYFIKIKETLTTDKQFLINLLIIGTIGFITQSLFPPNLAVLGTFLVSCLHVAFLYGYYTGGSLGRIAMILSFSNLLFDTIVHGMFGQLAHWVLIWIMFISMDSQRMKQFLPKIVLVIVGIYVILIIQSIKFDYRQATWRGVGQSSNYDAGLMYRLINTSVNDSENLLAIDYLLLSTQRFNQGGGLAEVLNYVPRYAPFANGEVLQYLYIPFIPRLFWPDKPLTDGKDNIRKYTTLSIIDGNTVNISPLGEAYANFGVFGGIIYTFGYGLLLCFMIRWTLSLAENLPVMALWLPFLILPSLNMESDLQMVWSTFVINGILLYIMCKITSFLSIKLIA